MSVTVVVPVYNEEENVAPLAKELCSLEGINERDQLHFGTAVGADEGINFPNLLDQLAPLLRRNARRLVATSRSQ
jgi:hypothetical protein